MNVGNLREGDAYANVDKRNAVSDRGDRARLNVVVVFKTNVCRDR